MMFGSINKERRDLIAEIEKRIAAINFPTYDDTEISNSVSELARIAEDKHEQLEGKFKDYATLTALQSLSDSLNKSIESSSGKVKAEIKGIKDKLFNFPDFTKEIADLKESITSIQSVDIDTPLSELKEGILEEASKLIQNLPRGGGAHALVHLKKDVVINNPQNNDILKYDATTKKWINSTPTGGSGAVDSVNGQTGVVVLDAGDVGAATTAQGALADTALQPATIGVSVQGYSAVLAATTASFTTADETKLDGIEAGAQVNTVTPTNAVALSNKTGNISQWTNDSGYATTSGVAAAYQPLATVLTNTTASFTTAQETKLAGIEALADVTDTANVTSAGALMDSEVTSLSGIKTLTIPDNTTITAAAATVLDDTTVGAMVDTLGGASSTGTGGLVRATSPTLVTPALGVASATSIALGGGTALANYLEGTFTPTFTFATVGDLSVSYATQSGKYTRVGNIIYFTLRLTCTPTFTTSSGNARIGGMPSAFTENTQISLTGGTGNLPNFGASKTQLEGQGSSGNTYIQLQGLQSAGAGTTITASNFTSATAYTFFFRGFYFV